MESALTATSLFWECYEKTTKALEQHSTAAMELHEVLKGIYAEISVPDTRTTETLGWVTFRVANLHFAAKYPDATGIRRLLAYYMSLPTGRPSKLHSCIMAVAARLATKSPDFHFASFCKIWNLTNLLPEDHNETFDLQSRKHPSLYSRIAKAYAYSLLLHPQELLDEPSHSQLLEESAKQGLMPVKQMIATKVHSSEVNGRKITFVTLVAPDGTEAETVAPKLTAFRKMRYEDIAGSLFDVILHSDDDANATKLRVEAAVPDYSRITDVFPVCTGYIEYIDMHHRHVHIYDSQSRHLVAVNPRFIPQKGQYVRFVPIIPKHDKFKSAIITEVLERTQGQTSFGLRRAKVSYTDEAKGYCAWELLPGEQPIIESGTDSPSFTSGFISRQTAAELNMPLPAVGTEITLITFLKRGKDKQKRPYVVYFSNQG